MDVRTIVVVMGAEDVSPWEGQRCEMGADDVVVLSAEPIGDEYVHRWGQLHSRRWKVTIRRTTPEEDAEAAAEEAEADAYRRLPRPWWRFW